MIAKWALSGLLVGAGWLAFAKLAGAVVFRHFPQLSFALQMIQFFTWPTSIPGVIPYMVFGNWYLFMAAIILLNGALYALIGSGVFSLAKLWKR